MYIVNYSINSKNKSVNYSYQGNHSGQLDFCSWLENGSITGCDYHYAPPSLLLSNSLIRPANSRPNSGPVTRLSGQPLQFKSNFKIL